MAIGQIQPATYRAVAHGALNWDVQLRADLAQYDVTINTLIGSQSAFQYAGTVKHYQAGVWETQITQSGNLITITFGLDPGSNGLSTASSNNVVGTIASGYRPTVNQIVVCGVYNGADWGRQCKIQVTNSGQVTVADSPQVISNGFVVAGAVTYRSS